MPHKTIGKNDFLLIEVPVGIPGIFEHEGYMWSDSRYKGMFRKKIPKGYTLIGLAKDISEEGWQDILDYKTHEDQRFYQNYMDDGYFEEAVSSGRTLIEVNEMNWETTVILKLKK